jgi:hypothetical protein
MVSICCVTCITLLLATLDARTYTCTSSGPCIYGDGIYPPSYGSLIYKCNGFRSCLGFWNPWSPRKIRISCGTPRACRMGMRYTSNAARDTCWYTGFYWKNQGVCFSIWVFFNVFLHHQKSQPDRCFYEPGDFNKSIPIIFLSYCMLSMIIGTWFFFTRTSRTTFVAQFYIGFFLCN